MKIAIDCRVLAWKHSGIARYLSNVLPLILEADTENTYFLLTPKNLGKRFLKFKNVVIIQLTGNDSLYKFIKTPLFLQKQRVDIYWSPTQDLPLWKPKNCKYFITLHDAGMDHDLSPQSTRVKILYYLGFYKLAVKLADSIFTDSEFSKNDIASIYNYPKDKIFVTYLGIGNEFKLIKKVTAKKYIRIRFKINTNYIFFVNTGRPTNLLTAYKKMVKKFNHEIVLVILGQSSPSEKGLEEIISQFGLKKSVFFIRSHISDKDLNYLYAGAEFFVSPSFYEGFGLTPLEALKSGCPILVSNVTALPEIYQDSALYCIPDNIEDITDKLLLLTTNEFLRKKLMNNSKVILKKFTWEKVAKKILVGFSA